MAYFDRNDILAAWNLHLQATHTGQGSRAYARLSRLQSYFKPAYREHRVNGLSDNAIEIYDALRRKHNLDMGGRDDVFGLEGISIANASESTWIDSLYLMWAEETKVYVWAKSFDDAFEVLVEWLDDNAPGLLVSHEEFTELLAGAIQELHPQFARYAPQAISMGGQTWLPLDHKATVDAFHAEHALGGVIDEEAEAVLQLAEADLTSIGHTTLNNGGHIASYEWGGDDVTGGEEYESVLIASRLESANS